MSVLAADLRAELADLDQAVANMAEARAAAGDDPDSVALWASGATLQAFYNGVEKYLTMVAESIDGGAPSGRDWHRRLLRQVSTEVPTVRPPILDEVTAADLEDYLDFRHKFRNMYVFKLKWAPMRDLLDRAPALWPRLRVQLAAFADWVERLGASGR